MAGSRKDKDTQLGTVLVVAALVVGFIWWTNRQPSPPGNVLLVGDSLFFQSTEELSRLVEGDGWTVNVQASIGAGIHGGGLLPADWAVHLQPIVEAEEPEVVVIELGTNGCGPSCDGIRQEIDEVLGTVRQAQVVVWLTVRAGPAPEVIDQINRQLEAAEGRWSNLEVAPMHEWYADRPDLLTSDAVHLNDAGQQFLAERVRHTIRQHLE